MERELNTDKLSHSKPDSSEVEMASLFKGIVKIILKSM